MEDKILETSEKNVSSKPKKQEIRTKKITASVVYSSGNKTSVSYNNNGEKCAMFIKGTYKNKVEIEYTDSLTQGNIVKVTQIK